MKRRFVQKLLTGVTTVAMTASSLTAPMTAIAAPEEEGGYEVEIEYDDEGNFGDILEEAFEEENVEEYADSDEGSAETELEYGEDPELLSASATGLAGIPAGPVVMYPWGEDYSISSACVLPLTVSQTITWTSSDTSLVEVWRPNTHSNATEQKLIVNRSGKTGTCTITAKSNENPEVSKSFTVVVEKVSAREMFLEKTGTLYVMQGTTVSDVCLVSPNNATTPHMDQVNHENTLISATPSEGSIVIINSKGCLGTSDDGKYFRYGYDFEGFRVGKTTITYKNNEGGNTITRNIEVLSSDTPAYLQNGNTSADLTIGTNGLKWGTVSAGGTFTANGSPYVVSGELCPAYNGLSISSSNSHVCEGFFEDGKVCIYPGDTEGTATLTLTPLYGNGQTVVTAKQTITVTVHAPTVNVTGVSLDKSTLSLTKGNTATLAATVTPSNATNKEVAWTTSNASVATVNNGVVTAVSAGTATITAKTADGNKAATCTVTVSNPSVAVTGVSLDRNSLTMTAGNSYTLTATVTPSNATNKSVTWSSSNTSVASVDAYGRVTAKAPGTAVITVKTNDGSKTASCTITVNSATVSVTGVSLNKTSASMTPGNTLVLSATVSPANATNKSVTWTSSNTSVATVNSAGVVTAKAAGTTYITATTVDGSKRATCTVTVSNSTVAVTGVSLNRTSAAVKVGDTITLTETVTPSNASDKSVSWTTSNASVATVSSTGVITGKAPGNATITVKTADGSKTASCVVTVTESNIAVTDISLDKTTASVEKGETFNLVPTLSPEGATNQDVTWTSENAFVANVDSTGKVTAISAGTVNISAISADGGYKATCAVTVIDPEADKIDNVVTLINVLPAADQVTIGDKDAIVAANQAYEQLTADQKAMVSNESVTKLTNAVNALNKLISKEEADKIAAETVESVINNLPAAAQVTADNKKEIESARSAYNNLTSDQKAKVDPSAVSKLEAAEEALEKVAGSANIKAAEAVEKQINENVPEAKNVTLGDQSKILAAESAYEKLTADQKKLVDADSVKRLNDAVKALEKLLSGGGNTEIGETLKYNEETGAWDYYVNGKRDFKAYKFMNYEGYKFIVANGSVAQISGLVMDPNSDLWYFCAEGQAVKHTGLVMYNEEWFYVNEGVLDTGLNALVPYNGGLFYVAAGRLTREVNGLVLDPNSPDWYFVAYGEVQNQYTGLATYNGKWFYVVNGKLAVGYTGVVEYDGQNFNVVNGMVY